MSIWDLKFGQYFLLARVARFLVAFFILGMVKMQTQVLKTNCSSVGKSLIPVIMRVKAVDPDVHINKLSRFKKEEPLESYSKATLITEFEKLTGKILAFYNKISVFCLEYFALKLFYFNRLKYYWQILLDHLTPEHQNVLSLVVMCT